MRVIRKLLSKAKIERKYTVIKGKTRSAMQTLAGPFTRYRQQMIAKRRLNQRTTQDPPQVYENHGASPDIYIIPPSQIDLTPLPLFELDLEAGVGYLPVAVSHGHKKSLEYTPDHLVDVGFPPGPASLNGSVHEAVAAIEVNPLNSPRSKSILRKPVPDIRVARIDLDSSHYTGDTTPRHKPTPDPKLRPFFLDKVSVNTQTKRASLHELSLTDREETKNNLVNKAIMATQRARDLQIERFEADLRDLDADIERMKVTGDCTREELAAMQQRRTMGEVELLEMAEGLERVQELLLNPKRWP